MGNETGFLRDDGPLAPSVPQDIAARAQRGRILDAVAESCAEETFGATTISDVVGRAGISRATFYKHFGNKKECFDAAVDSFVEEVREVAESAHSDDDHGPEKVRKAIAAVLDLMAAKPAYTRLLIVEAISVDATLIDRYRMTLIQALNVARKQAEDPRPTADELRGAYGQAQVLIANQILKGRAENLPELRPDLVYIALLPFIGQEEALKQAQMAR